MSVLRSNISLAKSIFTTRLGQEYVYGGSWSTDPTDGTDCSGLCGTMLEAVVNGPSMTWGHPVSTESWSPDASPGDIGPFGTVNVASPDDVPSGSAAIIAIHHGGGGPDSHMNICVDGMLMEDNGDSGVCTFPVAMSQTNPYWNQWHYLPGPIVEDTTDISLNDMADSVVGQFL